MKTFLCFFLHKRKILLSNLFLLLAYHSLEGMQHPSNDINEHRLSHLMKRIGGAMG